MNRRTFFATALSSLLWLISGKRAAPAGYRTVTVRFSNGVKKDYWKPVILPKPTADYRAILTPETRARHKLRRAAWRGIWGSRSIG